MENAEKCIELDYGLKYNVVANKWKKLHIKYNMCAHLK